MARHEEDREDLIRDAVALRNRIEWQVPGEPKPVVTGLRTDLSLSVYFGQDPVFHFNPDGQLRRAFVDGFLYRTQGRTLAKLHRERSDMETVLARRDLDNAELTEFVSAMRSRLANLQVTLETKSATVLRSVLEDASDSDLLAATRQALTADPPLAPAFATRRK